MKVIVTGGAGFIGSHATVELVNAGHEPVIVDNFSNSKPVVVDRLRDLTGTEITSYTADLNDRARTREIFEAERPDAVIHFAGFKAVGESVAKPLEYYENNLGSTFSVLEAMQATDCTAIIFSSSATVYGDADVPMVEDEPYLDSASPYGYTKVVIERILRDVSEATGLRTGILRYFNPVGAHPSATIGEDPLGIPNNLMPMIASVAAGRRDKLTVFGNDYPTDDGTCERDYIHVVDLAVAHVAALEAIAGGTKLGVWNVGTGTPTSVLELITAFQRASGVEIPYEVGPRRPGDRAVSYASSTRIEEELGFRAKRTLEDMCRDTWNFQQANPQGYPA